MIFRICLPLCTPVFISAGIFAFTMAQHEVLYALIFLTKTDVGAVPVRAIAELVKENVFYWGQLIGGGVVGFGADRDHLFPVREHHVSGLTSGSVEA